MIEIPISDSIQFDPALRELLLRKTGDPTGLMSSEEVASEEIPVVVSLIDAAIPVEGLTVVARFGHVVTGRVPLGRIVDVRTHPNIRSLKASQNYAPGLVFSVPEINASPLILSKLLPEGVTGKGVIIGICDWGCDFAHANFRYQDGSSRLLSIWDQRGGCQPESPEPFRYGRKLNREQINTALVQVDPYAALNYDPAQIDFSRSGTHGTHVLDIAAGNGAASGASPGVAPGSDLIFVHLKGTDTRLEDNLGDSVRLLEAIRYIFDEAGDQPVVVNLSLGSTGGPHDATPLVVQGLDALLEEKPGRAIVLSAGNYYGANLHSSGHIQNNEFVDLRWVVTPRQDEIAEMEIWYSGSDELAVELIDPLGRSLARVSQGSSSVIQDDTRVIASIYHRRRDPNNSDHQIDIFLWPDALIGQWITRLHGESVVDGRFHAWIERDDPLFQSRFTPDCATQSYTTGTICNGDRTIAVGAYDARDPSRSIVPFSSAGPTRDERVKPDCSAPGAGIRAARSSQVRSSVREMDGLTVKSGTSMAAPHVTGIVALMFEAAGEHRLDSEETKRLLIETCRHDPLLGELDKLRYGTGRVDAAAAVNAIKLKFTSQQGSPEAAATLVQEAGDLTEEAMITNIQVSENISLLETFVSSNPTIEELSDQPHLGDGNSISTHTALMPPLEREQLAAVLPHLLVEMGNRMLCLTDEYGLPVYDKQQPLRFAPTNRTYSYENGRYNYHAANFVYNTAYESGYNIPVYPSVGEGRSFHNIADTFKALVEGEHNYFERFFEVIVRPGDREPLPLQQGDVLLRGSQPGIDYGHMAIIAEPALYEMSRSEFNTRDSSSGKGVQCIDAGLSIHTLDDHFMRALTNKHGIVLDNRMVLRFCENAIDVPRIAERVRQDPLYRELLENAYQKRG